MSELTIGQQFAVRWLLKNYEQYKDAGTPVDLLTAIAKAFDSYAARKVEALEKGLLDVALSTIEGESKEIQVAVSSKEILEDRALVWVASVWTRKTMDAITRFPV